MNHISRQFFLKKIDELRYRSDVIPGYKMEELVNTNF